MDDGAFGGSQVLLQSTTPDVLRTPWLHTIQSNKPVVRLEEAAADREHQLLLESQVVMAESLSLMEQHSDQQAILDSMGDAPMSSSARAVVALSVDPSVGVGGVPCSEPMDDGAFEPPPRSFSSRPPPTSSGLRGFIRSNPTSRKFVSKRLPPIVNISFCWNLRWSWWRTSVS